MKRILPLLVLIMVTIGCKSSKKTISSQPRSIVVKPGSYSESSTDARRSTVSDKENLLAGEIVRTALSYSGTRYKYGGTTAKGMDCSGLIFVSFKEHDIPLQRSSSMMASQGKQIDLKEVQKGDLLFFTTGKNKRRINHVGLVVSVENNDIKFIHATTSRGVLVSSIKEGYWNYAFREARRVL